MPGMYGTAGTAYNGTTIWPSQPARRGPLSPGRAGIGGNFSTPPDPDDGIRQPRPQQPRPVQQGTGFGGGGLFGATPGQGNMRLDPNGNQFSTVNAGPRRLDNSSVNFGGVAALSNYLNTVGPAQQGQAAQYLRSQGIMPTYNGMGMDQAMRLSQTPGGGSLAGPGSASFYQGSGMTGGLGGYNPQAGEQAAQWNRDFGQQNMDGQGNVMLQNAGGVMLDSTGTAYSGMSGGQSYLNGRASGAQQGFGGGSAFGMGGGGGQGGYSGATFPLEGAMQNSIMGILQNPSPYSDQQTNMMRNRSTNGIDQQRQMATQQAQQDAARRGVSPQEAAGNLHAIGQSYDRTRQGVQSDFELQNAMATRQGLMGGLGAGQGLLGQQFGNEDSIRRYLAMMGASQNQMPMFLQM